MEKLFIVFDNLCARISENIYQLIEREKLNETFSFVFIQVAVKHPDIVACGAQDGRGYLVNGAG